MSPELHTAHDPRVARDALTCERRQSGTSGLRSRALLIGALGWALSGAPVAAQTADGIQVQDAPFGPFGRSVTATMYVEAPPKAVFGVLTDYDHLAEFMPLVNAAKTLETSPKGATVLFKVRYMRFFEIEEVDVRTHEPYSRITWQAIKGPLKVSNGSWVLKPQGKGTHLTYQTDVDPGMPVPSALTGMLLKQGLPEFLTGIKRRAESGGTWKKPGN
ncbi:Polyketide cyclase / dehydrase and lipid transport [compost metagenome]